MPAETLSSQRPSSEVAAWLRVVCEDPYDDTPRLVYADWLEENGAGSLRAELVRVQVELSRRPLSPACTCGRFTSPHGEGCAFGVWYEGGQPLRLRERELLAWASDALLPAGWMAVGEGHWGAVARDLPARAVKWACLFRRGFAEAAVMQAEDLVPRTPAGRSVEPEPYPRGVPPPGLLLFKSEPLTAVRLAGKRPYSRDAGSWAWWSTPGGAPPEGRSLVTDLPWVLWVKLAGHRPLRFDRGFKWYPSEAAAREALSRACIDYGREWAGLPALTWGSLP